MDTAEIYCFGQGCRYRCLKTYKTVNLQLQIFEIKPESEEIVHFYLTFFEGFNVFLMKTAMLCFGKFHFLLAVGEMFSVSRILTIW